MTPTTLSAAIRHRAPALVAVALLALARAGAAQTPGAPLAGQVVDSAGKPVSGQHVTLHRVDRESGAMVDSAVTDAQGRFTVRLPAETAAADTALYFVATRWQGQLYIGTPFKRPIPAGTYSVQVGVNPVEMGSAAGAGQGGTEQAQAPPPPGPSSSTAARWFLVAMLALVGLGAIGYALVGSARERAAHRRRVLLARIAELDERAAAAPPDEADRLRDQRAELVSQLSGD